jgi:hypothetical protein
MPAHKTYFTAMHHPNVCMSWHNENSEYCRLVTVVVKVTTVVAGSICAHRRGNETCPSPFFNDLEMMELGNGDFVEEVR